MAHTSRVKNFTPLSYIISHQWQSVRTYHVPKVISWVAVGVNWDLSIGRNSYTITSTITTSSWSELKEIVTSVFCEWMKLDPFTKKKKKSWKPLKSLVFLLGQSYYNTKMFYPVHFYVPVHPNSIQTILVICESGNKWLILGTPINQRLSQVHWEGLYLMMLQHTLTNTHTHTHTYIQTITTTE